VSVIQGVHVECYHARGGLCPAGLWGLYPIARITRAVSLGQRWWEGRLRSLTLSPVNLLSGLRRRRALDGRDNWHGYRGHLGRDLRLEAR
jgi:hypothetical protein